MKLPLEISPNPIVTATIEIRYNNGLPSENILQQAYPLFFNELPNLEQSNVPKQIKNADKNLKFVPDFSLNNGKYKVGFTENSFTIECIGDYPLWENYFKFAKNIIEKFLSLGRIQSVNRIGIRYGNIFANTSELNQVLGFNPGTGIGGYSERVENMRTILRVDEIKLFVQIFENATATRNGTQKKGVYIDIDSSLEKNMPPNLEHIHMHIDKLHQEQKKVFFNLLKPSFLNSLNPKY